MQKNKVLCYVRPWNRSQFQFISREVFKKEHIKYFSEHKKVDECGVADDYYKNLKAFRSSNISDKLLKIFPADCVDEIILRCRLLRTLSRQDAERHIYAMSKAIFKMFEREAPSYIISITIDSFFLDLVERISRLFGAKFIGLSATFVNGYFRITSRGEATETVCERAIERITDDILKLLLTNNYTPYFNKKAVDNPYISTTTRIAKNVFRPYYFYSKRLVSGELYNYHYWSSEVVSKQNLSLLPIETVANKDWEKDVVQAKNKPLLYVPLQMYPECTIDYWCDSLEHIDYISGLLTIIERLKRDFTIIVKEHPSVNGMRPKSFYRTLKSKGVVIIPTKVHSNSVVNISDAVLVWTGSVGYEAALRGKAVISPCRPYYASGPRFKNINNETKISEIQDHVEWCATNQITNDEQYNMLKVLATRLIEGHFNVNGQFDNTNLSSQKNLKQVAKGIRCHIGI